MAQPRIVLASASPRRRELLSHLGLRFEVRPTHVDEETAEAEPARAAEELARRKARAAAALYSAAAIIGSDTIVALEGRMLGKPGDAEQARAMLRALRGRTHEVITGMAVECSGQVLSDIERTAVRMREYSDAEIEAWVGTGEAYDKAGGYAIQDPVFRPVAGIEGCECAVIGLPLWGVRTALRALGLDAAAPDLERCSSCPARER